MKYNLDLIENFKKLFSNFSGKSKRKCLIHVILIIIVSLIELSFTSSLIPLSESFAKILSSANLENLNKNEIVLYIILFGILGVVSGVSRSLILWRNGLIASKLSGEIASQALENNFKLNIYDFYNTPESNFISNFSNQLQNLATYTIRPLFDLIAALSQIFVLSILLLSYAGFLSGAAIILIGSAYLFCVLFSKPKLGLNSKKIKIEVGKIISLLTSIYRLQRESRIINKNNINKFKYKNLSKEYLNALASNNFFASFPRFTIETLGIIFLIGYIVICLYFYPNQLNNIFTKLSLFILCASRILPLTQMAYASVSSIFGFKETLNLFNKELKKRIIPYENKKFINRDIINSLHDESNSKLILNDVKCCKPNSNEILFEKINLSLPKNGFVSIVGESGVGKSTLLDLIMGFYPPSNGFVYFDGSINKSNQKKFNLYNDNQIKFFESISYVSPSAYILEGTVLDNLIDFEESQKINSALIDHVRKITCSRKSDGININQKSSSLSMGQKQRVAISRSLILGREILILDEALSAIDSANSKKILNNLLKSKMPKLLILISHREIDIENSDMILFVKNKSIQIYRTDIKGSAYEKFLNKKDNK